MTKRKAIPLKTIAIDFLNNAFTIDELGLIEDALKGENIKLLTRSHSPRHIAGIEELFPQIAIFMSPDIVALIIQGLATNALYDALKSSIMHIYTAIKKKPFTRIYNSKIETDSTPYVHLNVGKANVILPINLDDEKFKYCVDKMFESINQDVVSHSYYLKYNDGKTDFECFTKAQIAGQAYSDWKQKQPREEQQEDETSI